MAENLSDLQVYLLRSAILLIKLRRSGLHKSQTICGTIAEIFHCHNYPKIIHLHLAQLTPGVLLTPADIASTPPRNADGQRCLRPFYAPRTVQFTPVTFCSVQLGFLRTRATTIFNLSSISVCCVRVSPASTMNRI